MVFGRPIYLPVDLVLGIPDYEMNKTLGPEFANQLANKLEIIHNYARNKIQLSTKHMIKEYSKRIHQHLYEKGDTVWFYSPKYEKHGKKLCKPWTGPYVIIDRLNDVIYKIKRNPKQKPKIVHHNLLKPYKGDNKPFSL